MRILVTGASGLLGSKLTQLALAKNHQVYGTYKDHKPSSGESILLDQTVEADVKRIVRQIRPDIIVNCAAMTDVDACENQPDQALLANATAVEYLANSAKELNAFLVQVSTDYVFNGDKGHYLETDQPDPINHYGLSKLKGEQAASNTGEGRYAIARASVVYGWGRSHRPNAATYVLDKLGKGEKISMIHDQYSSPTLNTNLASIILEIIERKLSGIYHTSGATRLNRYDFAINIARTFHLDTSLITMSSAKDLNWKAKRPYDSSLNVTKATRTFANQPMNIDNAMGLFHDENKNIPKAAAQAKIIQH